MPADTSKHYITLIVLQTQKVGDSLHYKHTSHEQLHKCACNLAFLYILLNAVELSLCVSTKKSGGITVVTRKEKMNEVRLTVITIITSFR